MTSSHDTPPLKLDESWAYRITLLSDLIARRVTTDVQSVSNLNLSQWRVLAAIADKPGRTASQVVGVTPMDKGIVSRSVNSLINFRFVERRLSQDDKRLSYLYLTQAGSIVYCKILEQMDKTGSSGRDNHPNEEQSALLEILDTFIKRYSNN